jgi:hypothetical protein
LPGGTAHGFPYTYFFCALRSLGCSQIDEIDAAQYQQKRQQPESVHRGLVRDMVTVYTILAIEMKIIERLQFEYGSHIESIGSFIILFCERHQLGFYMLNGSIWFYFQEKLGAAVNPAPIRPGIGFF